MTTTVHCSRCAAPIDLDTETYAVIANGATLSNIPERTICALCRDSFKEWFAAGAPPVSLDSGDET